jgi:hypothetical protein
MRENPSSGKRECWLSHGSADNQPHRQPRPADGVVPHGGIMDLAMAMGVTLFGLFVGSSAWFFHSAKRQR